MRVDRLTLTGVMTPNTYLQLAGYVNYTLSAKRYAEQALAEGRTLYSWEYPPEVIALTLSSPGGDFIGLLPVLKELKTLSQEIPLIGIAFGQACSAAGMMLTACDYIIATEGTLLGSIAMAAGITYPVEPTDNPTQASYFYTSHSGKFTGLPGEDKSPEEIQAHLKNLVDPQMELMSAFMEEQRPGIAKEITALNGTTFVVSSTSPSSKLFDMTTSSVEEVIYYLEVNDMKTFSSALTKLGLAGKKAKSSATQVTVNTGATEQPATSAPAFQVQTAASTALTEASGKLSKLSAGEVQQIAEQVAKLLKVAIPGAEASAQFAASIGPESTLSAIIPIPLPELLTLGAKLTATQADVLTVAKLDLPADKAAIALQALVAARDGAQQQNLSLGATLASGEVLGQGTDPSASLLAGLTAKIKSLSAA